MTDEMMQYFIKNHVSICTLIHGNRELHNINRPYSEGDSYKLTTQKMKELNEKGIQVSAVETTFFLKKMLLHQPVNYKGMTDILFGYIENNDEIREIFLNWIM